MSTHLKDLHDTDPAACTKTLKQMSGSELLEALDDTIQFDLLHKSNPDWIKDPNGALYRKIIAELQHRIQ